MLIGDSVAVGIVSPGRVGIGRAVRGGHWFDCESPLGRDWPLSCHCVAPLVGCARWPFVGRHSAVWPDRLVLVNAWPVDDRAGRIHRFVRSCARSCLRSSPPRRLARSPLAIALSRPAAELADVAEG